MKIKILSVAEQKNNERPNFEFINEQNRSGVCFPSFRFLQENPDFNVKPGDNLIIGDFIPDLITGEIMPICFPEFLQKVNN